MARSSNVPPAAAAARIGVAIDALEAAKLELDMAIVDALKAGGSVREVAAISPFSERHVQNLGHRNGWPTAAQQAERDAEKARRQAWNEAIDAYKAERNPEL